MKAEQMKKTVALVAAALAALLLLPSLASAVTYRAAPSSPLTGIGEQVRASVSADFNNDGADDIASTAVGTGQGLYIQLSDGDGTFTQTAASPLFAANSMISLRSADLNEDGNADLLALNQEGFISIFVYLGDGLGGFTAHGEIDSNQGIMDSNSFAVGQLNGDTHPDVVIGYYGSQFSVSYGDGIGGFTTAPSQVMPRTPGQGLDGLYRMTVGDFDNNGDNDIAFGLLPCNFEPPPTDPPDPFSPYCPAMEPTRNEVFIAEGDGAGNFTPAAGNPHPIAGGAQARITSLRTGNFNGDGIDDLAVSANNQTIQTFLGDDSSFLVTNPDPKGVVQTGAEPTFVQVADIDLDGQQDLVWTNRSGNGFELALQTGASGFQIPVKSPFPASDSGPYPFDLSTGDFNEDGATDLAGAFENPGPGVQVMLNSPSVEADAIDFGDQRVGIASEARTLSLRNTGAVPATVESITLGGTHAAEFSSADLASCVGTRPAGSSCNVHLAFTPGGIGTRTATVLVSYAGSPEPVGIPVTGNGTQPPEPPISISAGLKLKAPQKVERGRKLKVAVTLTNTGDVALSKLRLRTSVTKKLAKNPKPVALGPVAVGQSIRKVITVQVRKTARPGRKLSVAVSAFNGSSKLASAGRRATIKK